MNTSPILGADDADDLLPTPAISTLRRRKHWDRWRKSDDLELLAVQRLIKRGRRRRSLNEIARDADVDRNFLIRILEDEGNPAFKKTIAVVKALGYRVYFSPGTDFDS